MFRIVYRILPLILSAFLIQVLNASEPTPDLKRPADISERVYVNTDRKIYIAGENLMYSFYLIDTRTSGLANYTSIGYLLVKSTSGNIVARTQVKVVNGKATGLIGISDTLTSGYYQLEGYTNYMRNGSAAIFYKSQLIIVNRFDQDYFGLIAGSGKQNLMNKTQLDRPQDEKIKIISDKEFYGKREKIEIKVDITDKNIQLANLTVSIVQNNNLESDGGSKLQNIDNPLIKAVQNNEKPVYLAENKSAELLGRLTSNENGEGIGYHTVYMTSPDTLANFEYTLTDSKGYFRFSLPDYYNGRDLFIKMKENEGEVLQPMITIDSKFEDNSPFIPQPIEIDSSLIRYIKSSQDIVKVQKSYQQIRTTQKAAPTNSKIPYLFKVPNQVIHPSDFVELKDFNEISREIIPALKIRKHDKVYEAEILDFKLGKYLGINPVILLDGVMLDDISQLIPLGTKDVKKIAIINTKWMIDYQEMNGILSVNSYNNLWKNIHLNHNNLRVKPDCFDEIPAFYRPDYSLQDIHSREPDFRQLLYWNPDVMVRTGESRSLNLYTSDYAASYLVKAVGVTNNGDVVTTFTKIIVNE